MKDEIKELEESISIAIYNCDMFLADKLEKQLSDLLEYLIEEDL